MTKEKFLAYIAVTLAVAALLHYVVLHWALILDPMPLSVKEAAPILIAEAYAGQLNEGELLPYGIEQYPESTSVYGPIYTMTTGLLQLVCGEDVNHYALHRCFVGVTVLLSALLCGFLIWRQTDFHSGLLAVAWFYLTQIASMTVAAGPSALAVLFYVIGIVAMLYFGAGRLGLFLAIFAGFLGLLTKPYASLIIPAALIYTYLFHSPRRALIAAGLTALATGLLLFMASSMMPTYFHSVFQIHAAYATRVFENLLSQTLVFSKLNFGLILSFLVVFPYSGYTVKGWRFRALWGTEPLVGPDMKFDRFLVLIASAALLISLGWHGGAYLIYYNHLLLPPLLIAALSYSSSKTLHAMAIKVLLMINMALLLVWRPPLPSNDEAYLSIMSLFAGKTALVDPVFEPYAQLFPNVELVDNGETEYLIYYDRHFEGPLSGRSAEWEEALADNIQSGYYDILFLAPYYNRELLVNAGEISEMLNANYSVTHKVEMPIYFIHFRDWSLFGSGHAEVYLFQRRDNSTSESIKE